MTTPPIRAGTHAMLDCVVVGAGPAGTMAALYLQRFCRDIVLVDAGCSRMRYIDSSRNCPGFPHGIGGKQLLERLRQQADSHRVRIVHDRVLRLSHVEGGFCVQSENQSWFTRCVIVATGVVDRLPPWPRIEEAVLQGVVRLCAVCDAYEAEDKRIAVFGRAQDGVGHAAFLRTYSTRVALVLPSEAMLAPDDRMQAQALGIEILRAPAERCALLDGRFQVDSGEGEPHVFDRVYVSLGTAAQTAMLDGLGVLMVAEGEVRVDAKCETSVAGIYCIGDAVSALNQIGVAFGHAAVAATAIHQRLERNPRR